MAKDSEVKVTIKAEDEATPAINKSNEAMQESKRTIEETSKVSEEGTRTTREAGDAYEETGKKGNFLSSSLNGIGKAAGGMIAGFFGFQTIIQYFNDLNEAARLTTERMKEIADAANEAAAATLDLQAINLGYSERDERTISDFSQATGRSFQESARALTNFKSATASLAPEDQERLFNEAVLPFALTTSGSVEPAAKFIGRASQVTKDPQELTNLMIRSIGLAGETDPAQFLGRAGELLVSGKSSGLDPAGTLSLLGFLSRDFETAEASTGLRNVLSKLTADPATREQLTGLGIDSSQGFFSTINALADQGVGKEQVIGLVGGENERFLTAILDNIDDVNSRREQSVQAISSGDLVGEFNRELAEESPRHAKALQIAQQRQRIAALELKDAPDAQTIAIARNEVEEQLERAVQAATIDVSAKEARLEEFDTLVGKRDFRRTVRGRLNRGGNDGVPGLSERQREGGAILLTDRQRRLIGDGKPESLPLSEITAEQIAEAAAQSIESNGLLTDLAPGGDQSAEVELSDFVRDEIGAGPELPRSRGGNTIINNTYINNGTEFRGHIGDPMVDDQDGSERE